MSHGFTYKYKTTFNEEQLIWSVCKTERSSFQNVMNFNKTIILLGYDLNILVTSYLKRIRLINAEQLFNDPLLVLLIRNFMQKNFMINFRQN